VLSRVRNWHQAPLQSILRNKLIKRGPVEIGFERFTLNFRMCLGIIIDIFNHPSNLYFFSISTILSLKTASSY
jgi:hypothetical protein